ncbi:acyltransferase family protein [Mucilaginibacter sp. RT5R15]|nr:acyltransferase family protein [Mucilaginibacter flavidus]
MILVVTIHCSSAISNFSINPDINWWTGNFYDSISRCSVPIFIMVSGSLILPKTYSTGEFLRKRATRIIPSFAFWTAVFILFNIIDQGLLGSGQIFKLIVLSAINGAYFHLWFVYVLIGIYLATPIISKWIKHALPADISYYLILWLAGLLLNAPILNKMGITSLFINFPGYIGYFILGHYLTIQTFNTKRVKTYAAAIFFAGFLITFLGTYFWSVHTGALNAIFYEYASVNVAMMAAGVFVFVKHVRMPVSNSVTSIVQLISDYSFGIYLIHPLLVLFLERTNMNIARTSPVWGVPVTVLAVLLMSILILRVIKLLPFGRYLTGVN